MPILEDGPALVIQLITCGLLVSQAGIYLGLFRSLIGYQQPAEALASPFAEGVSVIIAAKNEAENLAANLPLILEQHHAGPFEVVVVNDHSSDETITVVRKLQQTYSHLHLVNLEAHVWQKPGKKLALMLGIKKAQYEVLLLTDADCYPATENWLSTMAAPFANAETAITIGVAPYQKGRGFLSTLVRYETFVTAFHYMGLGLAGFPYMGVGRNLAYRKSFFLIHGGFGWHHYLAAGDDDLLVNQLATKTNTAFVLNKKGFTWTKPPESWGQWLKQKKRHMGIGKYYKFRDRVLLRGLWALQASFYLLVLVLLVLNPYNPLNWGILVAKLLLFYGVSIPVLKKFQLMPLTLRAFGLDWLYQLVYLPMMALYAGMSKKDNEWG